MFDLSVQKKFYQQLDYLSKFHNYLMTEFDVTEKHPKLLMLKKESENIAEFIEHSIQIIERIMHTDGEAENG